jgi:hypothetical protein
MEKKLLGLLFILSLCVCTYGQNVESFTKVTSINVPGYDYPRLDSNNCAYFRLYTPMANKIQIDCCGKKYDMQKNV